MKPLPPHLQDMTQAKWDSLSPREKDRLRDTSEMHPLLKGLEGKRVTVSPPRAFGRSTFRVGVSTRWRPCHLAMRAGAHGSSDVIHPDEKIMTVKILGN